MTHNTVLRITTDFHTGFRNTYSTNTCCFQRVTAHRTAQQSLGELYADLKQLRQQRRRLCQQRRQRLLLTNLDPAFVGQPVSSHHLHASNTVIQPCELRFRRAAYERRVSVHIYADDSADNSGFSAALLALAETLIPHNIAARDASETCYALALTLQFACLQCCQLEGKQAQSNEDCVANHICGLLLATCESKTRFSCLAEQAKQLIQQNRCSRRLPCGPAVTFT